MAEDFRLLLGAQFDNASVKRALDAIPQSARTVQVEVKGNNTFLKSTTEEGNKLTTTLTKVNNKTGQTSQVFERTKVSAEKMNTSLAQSSKHTKTLGEDFVSTLGKVAKFGLVTSLIGVFTKGMYEAVQVVKDFDSAMTEFKKVSDLNGDSLDAYNKKLSGIGDEVARTTTEILQASTEFVKAGYTEDQSANLAKVASLYQNVADSQVDAGMASSFIISQLKAFNINASDSIKIIDKINELSNLYAVSSTDIATALTKTSSTFATYGNSIDETMAMVVGATELLPNQAGKVSKGLSSIGAEIVKLANTSGELTYKVNGSVKSMSLFNEQGEMLNTFGTLKSIKDDWDNMSKSEQSSLALMLGMKTQIPVFSAEMNNFDTAIKAVETSIGSSGSAMEENSRYMDSLQAKTTALKKQFESLVLGDGGIVSVAKGFVDLGTGLLKFANSDIGKVIIQVTLLTTALSLGGKAISTFSNIIKTGSSANLLIFSLQAVAQGAGTASEAFALLTTTMLANPLFWGAVAVVGITAIVKAYNHFNVTLDEQREIVEEITSKIKELKTEYDKLSEVKNPTDAEKERLSLLEAELANLKAQKKEQLELEYGKYQKKTTASFTQKDAFGEISRYEKNQVDSDIQAYEKLSTTKAKTIEESDKLKSSREKTIEVLIKEKKELDRYKSILNEEDVARRDKIALIIEEYNAMNESTDATKKNNKAKKEAKYTDEELAEKLKELDDSLSTLSGMTFSGLSDAFNTVRQAQAELNSGNALSIDTFESLMGLGAEYIAVMFNQANSIDTTTDAEMSLYKAKIDQMAITASKNQIELASTEIAKNGVGAYASLSSSIQSTTNARWDEVASLVAKSNIDGQDLTALQSRITAIRSWAESAKKSVTVSTMQTRATKSNTSANKENKNSLDELKKSYETVISYINKKIDSEIDKLKDLKDAEVDSIEDRIDALNKQKDIEESFWQAKIDALEKQNDTLERQIELEKLEEELARAKASKVSIYREGVGFVYESDPIKVAEAQGNLDEFYRKKKYEDELAELNKFKDDVSKNYEKQIADLENYKSAVEKKYDDQISYFEKWKDNFKSSVDAYENEQNRLLALQLTGIDFENKNWTTRLNNLTSFVNNWNKLQAQMTNTTPTTSGGSGGGSASISTPPIGQVTGGGGTFAQKNVDLQKFLNEMMGSKLSTNGYYDSATNEAVKALQKKLGMTAVTGIYNKGTYMQLAKYLSRIGNPNKSPIPMYASGIASIPSDGMAIMGDAPNQEIAVGSRLNNGVAVQASKGDGVINANGTRTFAGMINSLSRISGLGQSYARNDYDNSNSISISNLSVSLPSVSDGNTFVADLKNTLTNLSYQKRRK